MNRPHSFSVMLCAAVALAVACSVHVQAAEPTDPKAIVQQAADFLQKQPKFAAQIEFFAKVDSPDVKQENVAKYALDVSQPGMFAMKYQAGDDGVSFYDDGQELVAFVPSVNKYMAESAPESLGDLFNTEAGRILGGQSGGAGGFVLCVLDPDPAKRLLQDVTAAKYVGREMIDGKPYHHCRMEEEQFDWDIWIAAEGNPTIAKIQPDMTKRLANNPEAAGIKVEVRVSFSNWNFAPEIDTSTFAFTPPEGAEKLGSFFRQEDEGPHPLVGKVAPPFQLESLDGKPVDLARFAGKDIVILDFWATWCGPCIAAMPEVKAAADKFADRGVVLYFVNLQEDKDTIRAFLEEQKLDVPVALDSEGAVAAEYGVTGIPQTVIIGKDGKVQVVHVGFGGDLQKQLSSELEGLLAGKDLAAEELKKYDSEDDRGSDAAE